MCGLYGFLKYGNNKIDINALTRSLAVESAERGTDATGIAYCSKNGISIYKRPKSAYDIHFKIPDTKALIGHTRHATQGDTRCNENNHPFPGLAGNTPFALAHNGIITNDKALRSSLKLPDTRIKTDSFIAVQLIEQRKQLNASALKYMAETVTGSYSFSILDIDGNIWLVKGDSPINILHFPGQKIYVYASTPAILWHSLIDTELFDELQAHNYKEILIDEGNILKIYKNGKLKRSKFNFSDSYGYDCDWRSYGLYKDCSFSGDPYIDELKIMANTFGYSHEDIDTLLMEGFTPEEIEEYFYA